MCQGPESVFVVLICAALALAWVIFKPKLLAWKDAWKARRDKIRRREAFGQELIEAFDRTLMPDELVFPRLQNKDGSPVDLRYSPIPDQDSNWLRVHLTATFPTAYGKMHPVVAIPAGAILFEVGTGVPLFKVRHRTDVLVGGTAIVDVDRTRDNRTFHPRDVVLTMAPHHPEILVNQKYVPRSNLQVTRSYLESAMARIQMDMRRRGEKLGALFMYTPMYEALQRVIAELTLKQPIGTQPLAIELDEKEESTRVTVRFGDHQECELKAWFDGYELRGMKLSIDGSLVSNLTFD